MPSRRRRTRLGALIAAIGLSMAASACGLDVQTNKPYTPSEGINLDVGDVAIRNVLIISRTPGSGFLSATLFARTPDSLTGVSGTAIKADGSTGTPLTASIPAPVPIGDRPVVLTDRPLITITSGDLKPGLTAQLVMTFAKAGEARVLVPVVDGNVPTYSTISPGPATATPTPAP